MTEPTRVLYNTLEQVLSTDLNRTGALAGKAAQDAHLALMGGIDATPPSVVCRGLDASPGAGLQVVISKGSLAQFVAGVVADQSELKLGVNDAFTLVSIPAAGGLPHVVRISAAVGSTDTDSTVRNQLSLPSRVVTPVGVDKTRQPTLTFTATAGTAAALPVAPATPVGEVALWDVFVPAGAASLNAAHLMDLRLMADTYSGLNRHTVERGMNVTGEGTSTVVFLTSGRAFIDGSFVNWPGFGWNSSDLVAPLESAAGALVERHFYAVTRGPNNPVGASVAGGLVLVYSTIAPSTDGRPSAPVSYNPLFGAAGVPAGFYAETSDALWMGSLCTNGSGVFQFGGMAMDRNQSVMQCVEPVTGKFGAFWGWLKKPRLSRVNSTTVRIGQGAAIISGVPISFSTVNASTGANLASNDGPLLPSTWYYVYLRLGLTGTLGRRGVPRVIVPIISQYPPSTSQMKTTPEPGFEHTDYLFIGSFYSDGGSSIVPFYRDGNRTIFEQELLLATLTGGAPTIVNVSARIPVTSRMAIIQIGHQIEGLRDVNPGFAFHRVDLYASSGTPLGLTTEMISRIFNDPVGGLGAVTTETNVYGFFDVPVDGSGVFDVRDGILTSSAVNVFSGLNVSAKVRQVGYVEGVDSTL